MEEPDAAAAAEGLHESVEDGLLVVFARVFDLERVGQDHDELVAVQHPEVLSCQSLAVLHVELEDFDRSWARLSLRQSRVIVAEDLAEWRLLALADVEAGKLGAVRHSDVRRRQELHLRDADERIEELALPEEARVLVRGGRPVQHRRLVALALEHGLTVGRADRALLPCAAVERLEWLPVHRIACSAYLLLGGALLADCPRRVPVGGSCARVLTRVSLLLVERPSLGHRP